MSDLMYPLYYKFICIYIININNIINMDNDRDLFNENNQEIANQILTQDEIILFKQIYNFNFFNKLSNNETNLFRGIKIEPENDESVTYKSFIIDNESRFMNEENVYTTEFTKYINDIDNIINNEGHDDNLKYILIGPIIFERRKTIALLSQIMLEF